jgi:hypothetical protein
MRRDWRPRSRLRRAAKIKLGWDVQPDFTRRIASGE